MDKTIRRLTMVGIAVLFWVFVATGVYKYVSTSSLTEQVIFEFTIVGQHSVDIAASYDKNNQTLHAFVPKWAEDAIWTLQTEGDGRWQLDGDIYQHGDTLSFDSTLDGTHTAQYLLDGESIWSGKLQVHVLGEIPSMHIDTATGSTKFLEENKEYGEKGNFVIYTSDGIAAYDGDLAEISGRGNTTWKLDKKPYSFELDEPQAILGMRQGSTWVLLANYIDGSFVRNYVAFNTAIACGMTNTSQTRFVDLFLNGEYAGLYLLCEKIDAGESHISALSGSLIVKDSSDRISTKKTVSFETSKGNTYVFEDEQNLSLSVQNNVIDTIEAFEEALFASDGINASGHRFTEYIDLDSFAIQYLVAEIFGNQDSNFASEFYYIDPDSDRLSAGPIWDFDLSAGNGILCIQFENALIAASVHGGIYEQLVRFDDFNIRVNDIFRTQLQPYLESTLTEELPLLKRVLEKSAKADALRWGASPKSIYQHKEKSFEDQISYYISYMNKRVAVLSEYWAMPERYFIVEAQFGIPNQRPALLLMQPGESIPWAELYFNDYELLEICDEEGNVISEDAVFSETIVLKTKWRSERPTVSLIERYWSFIPLGILLILAAFAVYPEIRYIIERRKKRSYGSGISI